MVAFVGCLEWMRGVACSLCFILLKERFTYEDHCHSFTRYSDSDSSSSPWRTETQTKIAVIRFVATKKPRSVIDRTGLAHGAGGATPMSGPSTGGCARPYITAQGGCTVRPT